MYVLDQFIYGNCSWLTIGTWVQRLGFWVGRSWKRKRSNLKAHKIMENVVAPPG